MGIAGGSKRYVEARISRTHRGNVQGLGRLNRSWGHQYQVQALEREAFVCQCQGVGDQPLSEPLLASAGDLSWPLLLQAELSSLPLILFTPQKQGQLWANQSFLYVCMSRPPVGFLRCGQEGLLCTQCCPVRSGRLF